MEEPLALTDQTQEESQQQKPHDGEEQKEEDEEEEDTYGLMQAPDKEHNLLPRPSVKELVDRHFW